jgi:hypothetical protein
MNGRPLGQSFVWITVSVIFFAGTPLDSYGQAQPAEAENRQDEIINLNRDVEGAVDDFRILRSGDKLELNRYVTRVYPLRYANPFELFPYLKTIVDLEKGSIATARNPGPDGQIRSWIQVNAPEFQLPYLDQAVAAYDVPDFISAPGFVAFAYRTQHRSAAEVEAFVARSTRTSEGKITSDPATNVIYFQESPSDFKRVFASILFADIPVPQVDLDVLLIELTELDQSSLGLYWDAWKASIGGTFEFEFDRTRDNPGSGSAEESSLRSFRGLTSVGAVALAEFLNYLADQGAATILAETTLTVGSGQEGFLDSTIGVPTIAYVYSKEQDQSLLHESGGDFEGIRLRLRPIVAMQSAAMHVEVDVRSPVAISKAGNPVFSSQTYRSDFTIAQGGVYKIGGLERSVLTRQTRGIPGLKRVPYVRRLFSNEVDVIRRSSLYLFVRSRWSAPALPQAYWKDFHNLVQAFTIEDILRENPGLQMSPEDADLIRHYFEADER